MQSTSSLIFIVVWDRQLASSWKSRYPKKWRQRKGALLCYSAQAYQKNKKQDKHETALIYSCIIFLQVRRFKRALTCSPA